MNTPISANPLDIQKLGIGRVLEQDYDEVKRRLPDALKREGFGVLTEIDVQKTLKDKLGADFRRYAILGACNPPAALRVLEAEPEVGLLLPCNVVLYEVAPGRTRVSMFDPMQIASASDHPVIREVASDIASRLTRVLQSL